MATKVPQKFAASKATLSMSAVLDLLQTVGHEVTYLVEGDMGSGKTSLGKELAARTGMRFVYFDATTKTDVGDLNLPYFMNDEAGNPVAVKTVPHEEFGVHYGEDIVLMIDEYGKNRGIQNALNKLMQERVVGTIPLSPRSILFATTNLGSENVGDMLPPHARNRVGIVRMLKPSFDEWMRWAAVNDIDPVLIGAVHEFPQMLNSFTEYENPQENEYIYDPRDPTRTSFVTPRSLAKCSPVLRARESLGMSTVQQAMTGLIGGKAAADIITITTLNDTLPKYNDIVLRPKDIKIPDSVGAKIMSSITCMQRVEKDDYDPVHEYILRMPMEIQGLFFNQLMKHPKKQEWVPMRSKFTEFVRKNFNMFSADK